MEVKKIKVLLIEDNPDDAELIRRKLERSANAKFSITSVTRLQDGLEHLTRNKTDLILSDLGLPDSHGLDTVTKILLEVPHIPLVVLSGFDDEAIAIKAVQSGAQDYMVKGQLEGAQIERSLSYAIERARLQMELEQYTQEISKVQANLLKILEKNADAIVVVSEDRKILFANPAAEFILGHKQRELLNKPFEFPLDGGKTSEIEITQYNEGKIIAEINTVEINWEGKSAYLASMRNITERKRAEDALRESEDKFFKAFRHSPEVIVISSIDDGTLLEVNDTFLRLTGYTREEVISKKSAELGIWAIPEERTEMIKTLKGKGIVGNKEFHFRMKSGQIRTWLFSAEIINISNSTCMLSVATDITERKQMEETLRESEEKLKLALNATQDGLWDWDIKTNKEFFSPRWCEIIGYTFDDPELTHSYDSWASRIHPEDYDNVMKSLSSHLEKGTVYDIDYRHLHKSGEYRWQNSRGQAIFDESGKSIRMVGCIRDITDRKKVEEALRFSDAAFRSIHESVIATDIKYVITHWNQISEQIYGIKAANAIGKKLLDVIEIVENHPGENDKRFQMLEANGYYQEEQLHRTRQGEIWVDVSLQAIEGNGKRYGWVTLASAITQRKLAEEALKRSEEKYRELINTSNDGIVSTDSQMRFIVWNRGAEKIFGYKEKEMLGQSIMKIIPEKHGKAMTKGFSHISKTGSGKFANQILELVGLRKDGTEVPIELSMSSRKTGEALIATAIIRDVTERKEAEEKLCKIDHMKTEFLSNVSHELRTPLQSISGFTKLILDGKVPDPATQQEFLQIIDRETMHLGYLINSLLDMSRLESGRFQIYRKLIPIRDTIIDSVKMFHSLAREKNITLSDDIPPQLPEMEVDDERMRQVIINLLSNAIKFSDPGGSVNVKVEKRESELLFQISDHGMGIRQEAMQHLFERFYQVEGEMVRGGTGLGLYISKQIIEAHGGHIWAESKFGEGSIFSFTLPLNGKGGNDNGKENSGHRRRPGDIETGRLLTQA